METLEPLIRACGMHLLIEDDPTRGVDRTMLREMLRRSPRDRTAFHARGASIRRRLAGAGATGEGT